MADWLLSGDEMAVLRRAFARQILGVAGVVDSRLEAAFRTVPREAFLGPDPWHVVRFPGGAQRLPANDPVYAYQDVLFTLVPERGVNNGSPSLHTKMLDALSVPPGARVAHIGAGTGYYSAILAELVGAAGRVTAVEFDPRLAERARANLVPWENVTVIAGDGAGWPTEAADRVYINFAVAEPAAPWIENLAPGGRLVLPLGVSAPAAGAQPGASRRAARGAAVLVERREWGLAARWLCPAFFVCAEGALSADEDAQGVLFRAFERGGVEFIRSMRWNEPGDPGRCWLWSRRWSLCFDPIDGAGRGA